MNEPIVDILIPTYKPGQEFEELLLGLLRQTYPVRQILIVNTDESRWNPKFERLVPNLCVEHIDQRNFDHGGTRKAMAASSDADLLMFMTQDAIPANAELVEKLVMQFSLPQVKAAYARQLPKKGCSVLEAYTRSFNYPRESDIKDCGDLPQLGLKTFFCSNVCAMYDRKVYEELGGFVSRTIFNEDMIYAAGLIEAGYSIAYAAEAMVYHSHNYGCIAQMKRNFDLGVSQAQYPDIFRKYPSEGEGIRMVKQTAAHVWEIRRPWLLVPLFFQSGFKYLGFQLGKHYRVLPRGIILCCSLNKTWWRFRKKRKKKGYSSSAG